MSASSTDVEGGLDAEQRVVDARLRRLLAELRERPSRLRLHRLRPVVGIYLWGEPGRGKSLLVNRMIDRLGSIGVVRWHFHDFFDDLQHAITVHSGCAGAIDHACRQVIGDGVRVVVFDEFHVHDPGTATLLIRLLQELRSRGIVLVVTSNVVPEELLPDPLFRPAFAPGVALLREMTEVVELAGDRDYRIGAAGRLAGGFVQIPAVDACTFAQMCGQRLSARDYLIQAARLADGDSMGWHIRDIPLLDRCPTDWSVRFTHLVDVAADRAIPLWLTTPHPVAELLASCAGVRDGARLRSRLSGLRCSMRVPVVRG